MAHPRTTTLLLVLLVLCSLLATPTSAQDDGWQTQELQDDSNYWLGTTLTKPEYAPDATEAAIYDSDDTHVTNVTLEDGDLELLTADWRPGTYYVTAPGATTLTFTLVRQTLSTHARNYRVTETPTRILIDIGVSTNRGSAPLEVSSDQIPDFASRLDGDGTTEDDSTITVSDGGSWTLDLTGLQPGTYDVDYRDTESGVHTADLIELNDTVTLPENTDAARDVTRGDSYWRTHPLRVPGLAESRILRVETLEGTLAVRQLTTTSGSLYLATDRLDPGIYRVLGPAGDEQTRFEILEQTVDASIEAETLHLESNRATYDVRIKVANSSGVVTAIALPDREVEGEWTAPLRNDAAAVEIDSSGLAPGEYTVSVEVTDTEAVATSSFSVAQPTTTTTITTTAPTTMAETTTVSSQATSTSTTSTKTTPTTAAAGAQASTETTEAETPGLGLIVGVLAIVIAGFYRRAR